MGFNTSPFSGPNNAGSSSAGTNVHPILNDPEVRSLERLLRVKSKVELRLPGRPLDKPLVSVPANKADGCADGGVGVGRESLVEYHVPDLSENHAFVSAANETAGEIRQPDSSKFVDTEAMHDEGGDGDLVGVPVSDAGDAAETAVHATAGDLEGIIGLLVSGSSLRMPINSLNSSGSVDVDACARDPALLIAPASLSSPASAPASLAVVAHARSTPLHVAHNSGGTGGLLPVQRSTSYCLRNSWSGHGQVRGSHAEEGYQRWGFRSGRRFSSCLRGGGRGKFSAGRRSTGAG